ncbi:hypothetical protein MBLNU13_g10966t2 [Cladosporium sp. NU13]
MIDLSTKTFFNTSTTTSLTVSDQSRADGGASFHAHAPVHSETYIQSSGHATDNPAEEVDEMTEQANKRKQPEHQAVPNNEPKRKIKKHKTRIHPEEAGHSIEDLPRLSQKATQSDKVNAAEIVKSLGLETSGVGKGAEVWFVGTSEQAEDEEMEVDMSVDATETPSGGSGGGKTEDGKVMQ